MTAAFGIGADCSKGRYVNALPVRAAPLPTVVRAFDGVTDDRAVVQRPAPVQASVGQDPWSSVGGAERDQAPAEQRHCAGVFEVG